MSVIISKDAYRTIIVTANKKYIINQSSGKGIELLIGPIKKEKLYDELAVRIWIADGTKTSKVVENATEIAIYPVPLKVIEDIQERTNGDIKVEDVSEYYSKLEDSEIEAGKEFFARITGNIVMATI